VASTVGPTVGISIGDPRAEPCSTARRALPPATPHHDARDHDPTGIGDEARWHRPPRSPWSSVYTFREITG